MIRCEDSVTDSNLADTLEEERKYSKCDEGLTLNSYVKLPMNLPVPDMSSTLDLSKLFL